MAIFGINFNDFGSRKLRIDSQKDNVGFNSILDKKMMVKYAVPSQPNSKPDKKPADDVPTIKYGIPSENFLPYIHIKPQKPTTTTTNEPPVVKYGYPPED